MQNQATLQSFCAAINHDLWLQNEYHRTQLDILKIQAGASEKITA